MSIADKLTLIAENQQKVYDKGFEDGQNAGGSGSYEQGFIDGKQAEYDRFWDSYQDNGNRGDYAMAFMGNYWSDETFNPKYDFILTRGSQMFQNSYITKLASKLKEKGLKFDTSAITGTYAIQMFQGSKVKDVPELDLRKVTHLTYIFGSEPQVETIEKFIISERAKIGLNDCFGRAIHLTHCIFDGVLANTNMTLKDSTLLDKESIISLVNILSTETSGKVVTLSLTAVNKAFETYKNAYNGRNSAEWQALVATKPNWTISLA